MKKILLFSVLYLFTFNVFGEDRGFYALNIGNTNITTHKDYTNPPLLVVRWALEMNNSIIAVHLDELSLNTHFKPNIFQNYSKPVITTNTISEAVNSSVNTNI